MLKFLDFTITQIVKFFYFLLGVVSKDTGVKIMFQITKLILSFFPRSKYVCYRNLSMCFPGISKEKKEEIWKSSIMVLTENLIGFNVGSKLNKEEATAMLDTSQCEEIVKQIKGNSHPGILLLVPHFGNFELLAMLWCLIDKPIAILARGFNMHYLDEWWNKKRGTHGNIIFGRKGGFKQALNYLNEGKNVAILFDQNVKRSHSIFVDFFGIPASTTKTIGLASLKTSCKILIATMTKLENGRYKLIVKWIKPPSEREGTAEQKIHDTILDSHIALEEIIRENPSSWFWIHRRFKTRPLGEAEDFYDKRKFPEDLS